MQITQYDEASHYQVICSWWKAHNWPCIPPDHLPRQGYIIYNQDTPLIAGFVYKTDSAFCLFEFIVANPEVRGIKRSIAFDFLVEAVVKYSIGVGAKSLFISANNGGLMKKLEKNNFIKTDINMTNFIRKLK